jgi:hypothetical protein
MPPPCPPPRANALVWIDVAAINTIASRIIFFMDASDLQPTPSTQQRQMGRSCRSPQCAVAAGNSELLISRIRVGTGMSGPSRIGPARFGRRYARIRSGQYLPLCALARKSGLSVAIAYRPASTELLRARR